MDKHIIFEDGHIRAIFMKGSSQELIFSFGDLITRAKGTSINAEKSLEKFHFNVIGVMPKEKSWFPEASMRAMLAAIQDLIASFKIRVGYGGSMGGYAAIKYSNLLDLNRIVALVPQYSIDPEDIHVMRLNESQEDFDARIEKYEGDENEKLFSNKEIFAFAIADCACCQPCDCRLRRQRRKECKNWHGL